MRKAQLDTLIGGAIALLSVIGVILLALFGREIPDVLGYLAAGSVVWYGFTSAPAAARAVKRNASDNKQE